MHKMLQGRFTRPLCCNKEPYRRVNVLKLLDAAELQGFASPIRHTFLQAKELGGPVRHVVFDSSFWKSFVQARLVVPVGD